MTSATLRSMTRHTAGRCSPREAQAAPYPSAANHIDDARPGPQREGDLSGGWMLGADAAQQHHGVKVNVGIQISKR